MGTIIYNLQHKASPLTTYGEALTILAQNIVRTHTYILHYRYFSI